MSSHRTITSALKCISALAVASVFAVGFSTAALAADGGTGPGMDGKMEKNQNMMDMHHILTQTQAEALKPGDAMSMTCASCKSVMVQTVTNDQSHVKMMTVGQKMACPGCSGIAEVVATGKGQGKDAEVKHVCTKCGDDAMFCTATKPGSKLPADTLKNLHPNP